MNKQVVLYSIVAALIVGAVYFTQSSSSDEFESWKSKFGIEFNEVENLYRRIIFYKNFEIVKNHNKNQARTYDMGLNKFSALTDE